MDIQLPNHRSEPHWHPAGRYRQGVVPAAVLPWLVDRGSLTARMRRACAAPFRVRVIHQGRGRPHLEEARALGVKPGESALVREVQLLCGGVPWIFARTVIPNSTLAGPQRRLAHLGERPLGEFLFRHQRMRRGELELARLTTRNGLYHEAVEGLEQPPAEVWGRRSLFYLDHRPLLVAEFFLPTLHDVQ